MVGLPLAILESIWFLLQALVCGLLLVAATVLLPIVPLVLLFSMQPTSAVVSFFGLLVTWGTLLVAILYNLAQTPFRLLKATAKILALPGVGLIALLDWSDEQPINPEPMPKQNNNPVTESQPPESTLEEKVEREKWFEQNDEKNQYHFILGDIDWDSLPTLLQSGLKNRYPEIKGATVTLTVTDLKPDTESSLANWLPNLGKLFQQIKDEGRKSNPDYSQFMESLANLSNDPKLLSIIAQLTDNEKIGVQNLQLILEKLASMANIGLKLSIKDQDGNLIYKHRIDKLAPENLVTLLKPILESAGESEITADWIVKTFLNSIQNPQVLQENLTDFLTKSMESILPESLQTPEAKKLFRATIQFGQSVLSPSTTESHYKPKNSKDTPVVTSPPTLKN